MKIKSFIGLLFLLIIHSAVWAESKEIQHLRVGVIAPVSGDFGNYGIGSIQAMQMANETETGRKLELIIEDNRTDFYSHSTKVKTKNFSHTS